MTPEDLVSFIKNLHIFRHLNEEELDLLLNVMSEKIYKEGDYILREGDTDQTLLILRSGQAEILKDSPTSPTSPPLRIGLIKPSDCFGEMSLFDQNPRSASVRALEESAVLIFDILKMGTLNGKIYSALGNKLSKALRKVNQDLVELLQSKIQEFNLRAQASNLFIVLILSTAFYLTTKTLLSNLYGGFNAIITSIFGFGTVLFQGLAALLLIKYSNYPLKYYGLTLQGFRKEAWEGILYSIPLLTLFTLIKWILIQSIPTFHANPLFEPFPEKAQYLDFYLAFIFIYLLLVPVQEFVVRGCFQGCLRNFFVNKHRVFISILGSNLLFGAVHALNSLFFALGVFLVGMYWGYLYERQKSLVGVIVSHWLVGVWLFFILNASRFFVF